MANGRHITGRLSVGLPKREIRRSVGSGRLENQWRPIPIPTGFGLFCVGFIPEMDRSRTDIMESASELPSIPTDCPDALCVVCNLTLLIGGDYN
jgi:hypothetical protein